MTAADRPSPWWSAHRHGDRRGFLLARAAITAALRQWFAGHGFVEVETDRGHDAFLLDEPELDIAVRGFIDSAARARGLPHKDPA